MKFRTEINPPKSNLQIEHKDSVITFGSCFAENISEYFQFYRFDVKKNPFGVLYNPVSILNAINSLEEPKVFSEEDLVFHQDEWHSFYHHSDFSNHVKDECLNSINERVVSAAEYIRKAKVIIITFGTAFVFKHLEKGFIVSNCHKIPKDQFSRFRLSVDEAVENIESIVDAISRINNEAKIVFTVSPVRHWRDGAVENQLSKATLLLAVNNVVNTKSNCFYFPSYEIVMDDLRDYRYYESDLLHPNKLATDYIWGKFSATHFTEKCLSAMNEIKVIAEARLHRPRNIESNAHQKFLKKQLKIIDQLELKYGHLNLEGDKKYFRGQLTL
ncbi:MAG: GSCFA domain-containing protein [Ignavibacteriae bacterium]|nr:GSCFA domain-containing protein [Ignavibacteriota bacterium]